jgi:hypothetical protein
MKQMSLDASVRIPEDVVFRELNGEAILLKLDTGVYFGLDAVGTRIWLLLNDLGVLRAVHARVLDAFDVAPSVLERDLVGFVGELHQRGLVSIDS